MHWLLASLLFVATAARADLLDVLATVPEGSWHRANLNAYSSVWTPADLQPDGTNLGGTPRSIIGAWGGMAWDPNRAWLWIYGGGHANYAGNDVYYWSAVTQRWARASLPSEVKVLGSIPGGVAYSAVDGPFFAPTAAHTYDNNVFLPILDRLMSFGGGGYNHGGLYKKPVGSTLVSTGPYLFDPSLADPGKVGGSQGSHVTRVNPHPEVQGGYMWHNRDNVVPGGFVNSCTAYSREAARDVVYVAGRRGGSTALDLYRHTIVDIANGALDLWQRVGSFAVGTSKQVGCGYDPIRKLFVRPTSIAGFTYWNLNTPGAANLDKRAVLSDPGGVFIAPFTALTPKLVNCGFDFDPVRREWLLWCGDGRVWSLKPPNSAGQWIVARDNGTPLGAVPSMSLVGVGIIGKWLYAKNLDAFIGLQDSTNGSVWIYKPIGWRRPAALVTGLTAPPGGALGTLAWDYEPSALRPPAGLRLYCSHAEEPAALALEMPPDVGQATVGYVSPTRCVLRAFDVDGESEDSNAVSLS